MSSTNPTQQRPVSQPAKSQQMASSEAEEQEEDFESSNRFLFFNVMPSWMVSFVTHVVLIVLLALMWLPQITEQRVALEAGEQLDTNLEQVDVNFESIELDTDVLQTDTAEMSESEVTEEAEPESLQMETMMEMGDLLAAEESSFTTDAFTEMSMSGNETSGRSDDGRQSQIRKYGGNAQSEKAVELALEWLANHQLPDGGWDLDHTIGPGKYRDKNNPGDRQARNGATALALLPFLGHGDTHKVGKYKKTVRAGLEFLMQQGKAKGRGLSWHEPGGSMYSHGLVAIVFGEAYAMSGDRELAPYAQGSIWFIEDVQHSGGGWRYSGTTPELGDTSVVGWQLMAIKSGKMSGLDYSMNTIKLAERFLDFVSIGDGACYGYLEAPKRNSDGSFPAYRKGTTSVGLLCRMYMGWDRNNDGLAKGIEFLRQMGPSIGTKDAPNRVNMYYNYYATQVMKHWGGNEWDEWNRVMRDFLVDTQDKQGTKKGSWYWNSKNHSDVAGGRLYQTALATMTLEVYYRYLPLYGDAASEDEFPLD